MDLVLAGIDSWQSFYESAGGAVLTNDSEKKEQLGGTISGVRTVMFIVTRFDKRTWGRFPTARKLRSLERGE